MKPTAEGQTTLAGIQTRLLARRQDPQTSREAAKTVAVTLTARQEQALWILRTYGPGTTHELGKWAPMVADATTVHHELARRFPELARKGKAEVTGEVRDGCRVWRAR